MAGRGHYKLMMYCATGIARWGKHLEPFSRAISVNKILFAYLGNTLSRSLFYPALTLVNSQIAL